MRHHRPETTPMIVALALLALAAPAAAQAGGDPGLEPHPEWTVGWGATWFSYSPFVETGAGLEQAIELDDGLGWTVFADRWLNRWAGIHVDGSFHRPTLTLPAQEPSVNVWSGSLGLSLRPMGGTRLVSPYVFGSAGFVSYGVGGPSVVVSESSVIFSAEDTEQLLWQVGAGLDIAPFRSRIGNRIGAHAQLGFGSVLDGPFTLDGSSSGPSVWRVTVGLSTRVFP